jgi:hypothetical protein
MRYRARDFVETGEGYLFAVVDNGTEPGPGAGEERVPAYLRYVRDSGAWRKVSTLEAQDVLGSAHPEYLFHSDLRDIDLHGVPPSRIRRHHQPRLRAVAISRSSSPDPIERKAARALDLFLGNGIRLAVLGVTGSLLVGAHSGRSDIDLVVYDRDAFHRAREVVRALTGSGEIHPFGGTFWSDAFARRSASLSFGEYVWHERRKHNKFVVDGTKVDMSMVIPGARDTTRWRKVRMAEIQAEVVEDRAAFDYPARFSVDHREIPQVVSYTNTYTGQARTGEAIHARGWIEQSERGTVRLLVGTSREATGEFIKVIPA